MFPIDKKKTAMVILAKMGKDGKSENMEVKNEESMDDDVAEYKAVAEDMLQAINDKSVDKLMEVMKAFHEIIKHEDVEQDYESEEE
jgi:hypothetical protein